MKSAIKPHRQRLLRDLNRIEKEGEDSIFACPDEENILQWEATILGPENSPWEGGIFKLQLVFCEDYPSKPPAVKFISRLFHPNIYNDGRVCLDILDKNWSPVYDTLSVLISLRSLLSDPNENSPANVEAAQLYKTNPQTYYAKVKECVEYSIKEDTNEDS